MATKRPLKPASTVDITDEWGIYDPTKAGMPALFARLGRPVLQAAPTSARRERHRARRPERSSEGVGLAIAEALRRAGREAADDLPLAAGNPARALRIALRGQAGVNTIGTPLEPFIPVAQTPAVTPTAREMGEPTGRETLDAPATPAAASTPLPAPLVKTRVPRKTAHASAAEDTAVVAGLAVVDDGPTPAAKSRARRTTTRSKTRATAELAATVVIAPPGAPETASVTAAPVVAAPSARRPRGPVPLAAWAHAVAEAKPEPRRDDQRGFWRALFRIPAEVALVEYAHGAKIHRLLIEAGDDYVSDFV